MAYYGVDFRAATASLSARNRKNLDLARLVETHIERAASRGHTVVYASPPRSRAFMANGPTAVVRNAKLQGLSGPITLDSNLQGNIIDRAPWCAWSLYNPTLHRTALELFQERID